MIPACRTLELTANGLVYSGRGLWFGYSIDNTAADADATVQFWDGIKSSSVLIGSVTVPMGASAIEFPSGAAVRTEAGLFVSGATSDTLVIPYFLTQTRLLDGLALYDDDTRGVDGFGLLRLGAWLDEHGYAFATPTDVSPG